jgi:type II secretory pathway predicted ATPase ExeA
MPTTPTTGYSLRQLAERDERVFPSYPQVGRYFPAASIEDARQRLGRAIERGDGPGLVIGGPGTGKSLLLQVLATQYHERFDVVLPACARLCTRRALLQAILFELGLPYRIRDEGDLRLSLLDHLLSREECPTGLLLLVDEAQTLSPALLDELRVLTNLVRGGTPRVRLVLAGSSVLEECFAHPELESFSQRLSARCYLGPFGRDETAQFVRAQVAASSVPPDEIFASDAWEAIFEATDGVPRLVNQLCDRALVEACSTDRARIDRRIIQAAWSDIQQLPTPWDTPAPTTAPSAPLQVVEFGNLADEPISDRAPDDLLIVERSDDDELLDTEQTELDEADDEVVTKISEPTTERSVSLTIATSTATFDSGNPFAEEFDEEEVVLDNFASWDDMFRRETPRVQNRRDPEFSALVQAAISTVELNDTLTSATTGVPFRMLTADIDDFEIATQDLLPPTSADLKDTTNRPPLRLAVVSDSAPPLTDPKTAFEESMRTSSAWAAERTEEETGKEATPRWSRQDLAHDHAGVDATKSANEDPVLIVEDDAVVPPAPVRREEYRNLFSRLRSG